MKPIPFEEVTNTLQGPPEAGDVDPLPIWMDGTHMVSCWRPTLVERLSILLFGKVWLTIRSQRPHPQLHILGRRKFFVEKRAD